MKAAREWTGEGKWEMLGDIPILLIYPIVYQSLTLCPS